ncbi:MAG: serine/threonine protein kinase [Deltaproteobacteria bacterium]|nr:serine/threonine protein kinase [Deltaproteobacteria bacterium]MCW5802264.1 serine/threonine protein kinase [Deltaproteobacteria bacterium]
MSFLCPACRRTFGEAGFCPFDGAPLAATAAADQKTILSAAIPAQAPEAHKTDIDPRGTVPLSPAKQPSTQEITHARKLPPSAPPSNPPSSPGVVRAMSASENPEQALEAYRSGRAANEYDKLVGQTLDGRYYVEKKIGEGGMGVVFAARHAVIERPLAIKVLKREVMRDTATIRRFVQEAKAASRIGHPNIVDVTDFGTTPDGMTYSVMEYVTGDTLGAALRVAAPFPAARAIRIAAQIARALGAAHDKGIIHRDLKPENVFLVDRDGRMDFVKIVDFGIAKVTPVSGVANPNEPRLTRAGSVFGTPEYMAPEQAAGRNDTDGRVDVYALGIILYEMLVGRVPHRGDSMVRTLAMQMLDPVEPPRKVRPDLDISAELEEVLLRALAKKREHRYQTMGELLAALDGLQTPVGTSVTGSPVYALTPLPPGADPIQTSGGTTPGFPLKVTPMPPGADSVPHQISQPLSVPGGNVSHAVGEPRSKSPTNQHRRMRDEPEFVTREKPVTFEHVFTEEIAQYQRRRWPMLVFGGLIVGGAAGAIALVVKSHSDAQPDDRRDTPTPIAQVVDAPARIVDVPADAVVVAEIPADAATLVPFDATDIVFVERPDAGIRLAPRDTPPGPRELAHDGGLVAANLPVTPNGRGTIMIQVITKPEGATLYVGTSYRGVGGTTLEEPFGTRMDVTCRMPGYESGTVHLDFDGHVEGILCTLKRIKRCIRTGPIPGGDGIKNPFDNCIEEEK